MLLSLLPAAASAQQPETCGDLAACRAALAGGAYATAEQGLERLRRGSTRAEATVALARVHLETGRYQEAADLVRPLASAREPARADAATLLGEAEMARGRLDEAQQALEAVSSEPAGPPGARDARPRAPAPGPGRRRAGAAHGPRPGLQRRHHRRERRRGPLLRGHGRVDAREPPRRQRRVPRVDARRSAARGDAARVGAALPPQV
ncbi:MAG: tetratricopeptide repeat protein [Sandaracinaceae bacterium]|nr:tetratricopeptide repeat protein [Sandaracinaceae bacterium]